MHLNLLELVDWRSYAGARVDLGPGVRVFVGDNAQGKTNLLEAVHYLAIGGSHRVASDVPLVREGADAAVIRAGAVLTQDREGTDQHLLVELELRPQGRNRGRVNGQVMPRARGHRACAQRAVRAGGPVAGARRPLRPPAVPGRAARPAPSRLPGGAPGVRARAQAAQCPAEAGPRRLGRWRRPGGVDGGPG